MSLPADNLLSPYHDGELTAAERLIVEQQVLKHSSARQELSEIKQISVMLKTMPRLTLPTEFPQQVLKGIELEMLIPSESPLESRDRSSTSNPSMLVVSKSNWSPTDSSPRRWLVGAAALLTSAAGLMLMAKTVGDRGVGHPERASQLAHDVSVYSGSNVVTHSSPVLAGALDSGTSLGGGGAPMTSAASNIAAADSSVIGLRGGALTNAPRGAASVAKMSGPMPPPVAAFDSPRGGDSVASMFLDQATLKSAEIGDVVDALQTLDDEIAVVRLTVVDRHEGLNQLQLLFAKNKISTDVAEAKPEKNESVASKPNAAKSLGAGKPEETGANEGQQLMAVYVESDSERLSAALQELSQQDLVKSLQVELPISVAEISSTSEEAKDKVSEKSKSDHPATRAEQPKSFARRSPSQQVLIDTLNQARNASGSNEEIVAHAHDRKDVDQSRQKLSKKAAPQAAGKEVSQPTSRQKIVQVPADALLQQSSQNSQERSRSNSLNIGKRSQNQSKQNQEAQHDQRPMQVLFVVVNQEANGDKPASSAPADAKNAAPAKGQPLIKSKATKRPEGGGAA